MYGPVHKGLRLTLCSLLTRLGTCAWDDTQAVPRALDDLEGLLYMFSEHAAHEDRFVHVALEARRAGSSALPANAHEQFERNIAELRALAVAFTSAPRSAQPGLWRAIYLRFAEFAGENLAHMSKEEQVIQPLLESLYTGEEIHEIHVRLLASIGPEQKFAMMRLMLLGSTHAERVALLSEVKAAAPPPVFAGLLNSVRGGLPAEDFERLTQALA
jgi:hypothetical protein